jgi:hypothetical protein
LEQAKREVGPYNPYTPLETPEERHPLDFFLSQWIALESELARLYSATGVRLRPGQISGPAALNALTLQGVFTSEELEQLQLIRHLRNEVVHTNQRPKPQELIDAGRVLESLLERIRSPQPEPLLAESRA